MSCMLCTCNFGHLSFRIFLAAVEILQIDNRKTVLLSKLSKVLSCKVVTKNVTSSAKGDSQGHFLDRIFYIIMINIFSAEISHNNTDVKSLKKSISRFRNSCFGQRKKLWRKRKVENSVIGLRSSKSRMNVSTENMCVFGTS